MKTLFWWLCSMCLWVLSIWIAVTLSMQFVQAAEIAGQASWYSESDPGIKKTTANMEIFDETAMTCAIWDLPFNTKLKVTNIDNGKSVVVRVNDRGPARRLNRAIDLTKGAFSKISNLNKGIINVRIEEVQK